MQSPVMILGDMLDEQLGQVAESTSPSTQAFLGYESREEMEQLADHLGGNSKDNFPIPALFWALIRALFRAGSTRQKSS